MHAVFVVQAILFIARNKTKQPQYPSFNCTDFTNEQLQNGAPDCYDEYVSSGQGPWPYQKAGQRTQSKLTFSALHEGGEEKRRYRRCHKRAADRFQDEVGATRQSFSTAQLAFTRQAMTALEASYVGKI